MKEELTTERLILRRFNASDAEFTLKLLSSEEWLRYIGQRGVTSIVQAELYLAEKVMPFYEKYGYGPYGVRIRGEEDLIGMCGLFRRDFLNDPDIGFAFLPEHFGRGYAYESALAVLEEARLELYLKKILAITSKNNERSIKLLEKLGMHNSGELDYPGEKEKLLQFEIELH